MIEARSQWSQAFLNELTEHPDAEIAKRAKEALLVLQLGAAKHGDEPPATPFEHLEHLEGHLRRIPFREAESGLPHQALAAMRALLLFGSLIGLDK